MILDIDYVRAQFPAFTDPRTRDWAHLENAGGSYVPRQVGDLMADLFVASKVQPYWDFDASRRAGDAMDRAKSQIPATLGADADEVMFGPSTSGNTYVLAQALGAAMRPGDEIIVTNQDHEANIGAWARLAERGMVVREWQVDPTTGLLDPADLLALLGPRTRVVAVTHASNLAATINPVAHIAPAVHDVGALLVVDGVSYAPHAAPDVRALGCDVYLYSAYKTFGPHLGIMYVSRQVLSGIANQGHFFNADKPTYRLTPAGPDHAEIGAAAGILDYYRAIHVHHGGDDHDSTTTVVSEVYRLFGEHEQDLMTPLADFLTTRDGVRLVGSPSPDHTIRFPTFAFTSERRPSAEIYRALIAAQIACGHGNFYAYRLVEALGLDPDDGVVRISLAHYNTPAEVDRALAVLDEVL